jgi:hypothetical protein
VELLDHAPVQERHDGQPAAEDERPRRREIPQDGPEHPDRNADGRFLPRDYAVQYWQAGTGRLLRTETVQDRWRVGTWDPPAAHTVTTATDAGLSVRSFTRAEHPLLRGKSR